MKNKPVEKDMSNENLSDLVYRPPLRDGESRTITCINYDERRGYNQCLKEVREYMPSEIELRDLCYKCGLCELQDIPMVMKIAKAIKERIDV